MVTEDKELGRNYYAADAAAKLKKELARNEAYMAADDLISVETAARLKSVADGSAADKFFTSKWQEKSTTPAAQLELPGMPKSEVALKHDYDKSPVDLLPPAALVEVAKVLKYGADKYHRHNWRSGFEWSRLIAAALRHLYAFNDGEDNDSDSGLSHVAHAACMTLFLLEHQLKSLGVDDRYKGAA